MSGGNSTKAGRARKRTYRAVEANGVGEAKKARKRP